MKIAGVTTIKKTGPPSAAILKIVLIKKQLDLYSSDGRVIIPGPEGLRLSSLIG